jgi:DNA-binding beta-propeller fold protein YncE
MLKLDQDPPVLLTIPKPDKTPRPVDQIRAAVVLSTGDVIVADAYSNAAHRFAMSGKYIAPFATIDALRLAVNAQDQVAMLERDGKSVALLDRDGKTIRRIANKGTGYEFRNPVDVAFDPLGHLYVLDRDSSSVFVFKPTGALVSSFTVPEKSPGAFRKPKAMTLDSAGRIFIYDDRTENVLIYQ